MSGRCLVHLPPQSGVLVDLGNLDWSWDIQASLFLQWLFGDA